MEIGDKTNVGAMVDAAQKFSEAQPIALHAEPEIPEVLVVPSGRTVVSLKRYLDEYRIKPDRKKGTADLLRIDSFIAHVKRFMDEHSAVFVDVVNQREPRLVAVLDYNEQGAGSPRFGEHRAVYRFPLSEEWKAWSGLAGNPLDQGRFADFLEERIVDILEPSTVGEAITNFARTLGIALAPPQRILTLSKGLTLRVGSKVTRHINLSTGEAKIGFEEQHGSEDNSPLAIPGGFAIGIPVFRAGPAYQIAVRLRYRVKDGAVTWLVSFQQLDTVWDHAIDEAAFAVGEATKLPVFYGRPES